jgi:hypothetical protein
MNKMETEARTQMKIIEQMIAQSRSNISEGSIFYLIWGYLVLVAATSNYILLMYMDYAHHWIAWPILMTVGGIISGIMGARMERKSKVKTYVDRALNYLWAAFTFSLILVLVSMIEFGAEVAYPIVIILYGLGTFVSGGILRFKPLIWGGVLCWILGSIAVYMDFPTQLLLLIASILGSYIIPGHLLSNSKQNV